jgi:hypothetical protein
MDSYHRQRVHKDFRPGRECQFCQQFDPRFAERSPIDRSVQQDSDDSAASHLSENGHVRHRISEIVRLRKQGVSASEMLVRSA